MSSTRKKEEVHEGIDILLQVAQEKASSSRDGATGTSVDQSAYRSKRSKGRNKHEDMLEDQQGGDVGPQFWSIFA